MAKGDVNAKVGPHRDVAEATTVWESSVTTHEDFTKTQIGGLIIEADDSLTAFRSEVASMKPNWDLSDDQTAALWLAVKELGAL